MKKLISLFLALMMVFTMATVAFAVDGADPADPDKIWTDASGAKLTAITNDKTNGTDNPNGGSITITGIHVDSSENDETDLKTVYKVYKMLHLESYNADSKLYSYVIIDAWKDFFIATAGDDTTGAGAPYIKINTNGYVEWAVSEEDSVVAEFAKLAMAYASARGIAPVKVSTTHKDTCPQTVINCGCFVNGDGETEAYYGKFTDLSMGYYLVDSNVGALCGLTTTNPNGLIAAKNTAPTIDKQVQEDSAVESGTGGSTWFDHNSADIGQLINFDVTISVHAGAENYIFHDYMTEGLTFEVIYEKDEEGNDVLDGQGKKIVVQGITRIEHVVPGTNTATPLVEGVDYTLVWGEGHTCSENTAEHTHDCTFEIVFSEAFCNKLQTNDKIYINYNAKLNENAVVYDPATGSANTNTAHLEYGEGHTTTEKVTKTYTYSFDLVKTDGDSKFLNGATFKLYDAQTGGNEIMIVRCADGTYRRATKVLAGETANDNLITVDDGMVTIKGLDNGTYWLEEITPPPGGYNKLTSRIEVKISDNNVSATMQGGVYTPGTGIQVKNSAGSTLPSTGGLGTLLFTLLGGGTALGTGVVLVTKKRMSMIEE